MPGKRLAVLIVVSGAAALPSCQTLTLSNVQQRLDRDYAGGCVSQGGEIIRMVAFRADNGQGNLVFRFYDDLDKTPSGGTTLAYDVPGVPIAVAKCFSDDGLLRSIGVVTSDGMVHNVDVLGTITTVGPSGLLAVAGLEFTEGSAPGRKNIVVYGEGGGPFAAAKVFIDNGDGTYSEGGFPPGLGSVTSLALLDIDDDEDEDVVLGLGAGVNNVRTAVYDGAGAYAAGPSYAVPGTIGAVGSEDLDGDGDRDLVVASAIPTQPATVSVFTNNADGTLSQTDTEAAGVGPTKIAFGDLNKDGQPDAAIANGVTDTVTILFGSIGVTFEGDSTHVVPDGVADIAFSDFGPGDYPFVDLAVFSSFEDVGVLLLGNGLDLLSEQLGRIPSSNEVVSLAVANFDGSPDGVPEIAALAVPSSTGSQPFDLHVHWWDGVNDTFGPADPPLSVSATGPLAIGDLDGVNGPDLAAPSPAGGVEVMLNDGAGAFSLAPKTILTDIFTPFGVAFATIDDNPTLDAAVSYSNTLGVWFNNGDGTFVAGPTTAAPATTMAMGFDPDQTPRVALSHTVLSTIDFYTFQLDGTPTLTDSVDIAPIEDVSSLAAGDWDGDGDDDFVAVSNDDPTRPVYIVVLENTGGGEFSASTLFTGERADGWNIVDVTIADLEGDGPGEVVFTNDGFSPRDQFVGVISASRARGAEEIEPIESYLAGEPSGGVAVVDLSGDGRPWVVTGKRGLLAGLSALPSRAAIDDPGCNVADLAEPFGTLNFSDVFAYLVAFGDMDPVADLAEPVGVFNFSDVFAYLVAFGEGCP